MALRKGNRKTKEKKQQQQSNAVYHEAQENETGGKKKKISDGEIRKKFAENIDTWQHWLLIYCKNTFIIAVESKREGGENRQEPIRIGIWASKHLYFYG